MWDLFASIKNKYEQLIDDTYPNYYYYLVPSNDYCHYSVPRFCPSLMMVLELR